MTIGDNVKKIRTEKKLTQQQLADKMKISRSYLGDIENNRKSPSMNTVESLADKLSVSIHYLTSGQKTLYDLTEKEIKTNFESVVNKISDIDKEQKEYLKDEFKKLPIDELDFVSTIFLTEMLYFLKQSSKDDITTMTSIFTTLNDSTELQEDESVDVGDLKEYVNNELKDIESFIKKRFSIQEGD